MSDNLNYEEDIIEPYAPEEDQEVEETGYCMTEVLENLQEEVTTLKKVIEEMAEVQKSTLDAINAVEQNMEEMMHELRR